MKAHDRWLSQGDVFGSVPVPTHRLVNGRVMHGTKDAPALLLTDDCILDKRSDANPAIKRLNLSPIWPMEDQKYSARKTAALRSGLVNPPDPIYVNLAGYVATGEPVEGVAMLSETFAVPESYFGITAITDASDVVDSYRHAISRTRTDTRMCTMDQAEKRLLREKLALFWAAADLQPVCAICWCPIEEITSGMWTHTGPASDGHTVALTASHQAILELPSR